MIVNPPRSTATSKGEDERGDTGDDNGGRRGRQRVKLERRKLLSPSHSSPRPKKSGDMDWGDEPRKGLIHNTILEEDDSSEVGF